MRIFVAFVDRSINIPDIRMFEFSFKANNEKYIKMIIHSEAVIGFYWTTIQIENIKGGLGILQNCLITIRIHGNVNFMSGKLIKISSSHRTLLLLLLLL